MKESLSEIDIELVPIHQKLVHLRRQLVALGSKPVPPKAELKVLQEELRKIDGDGKEERLFATFKSEGAFRGHFFPHSEGTPPTFRVHLELQPPARKYFDDNS